jgi:hypothetical protein
VETILIQIYYISNQINNEKSNTTHDRMLKDPREWEDITVQRSKKDLGLQIGDFGCGKAKIMETIGSQRVYSFDHVAIHEKVTACDMKKMPLADEALDVAIFSLSLMGKNWHKYIKEAKKEEISHSLKQESYKALAGVI